MKPLICRRSGRRSTEPVWLPARWFVFTESLRNKGAVLDILAQFEAEGGWPDDLPPIFATSEGEILDGHHRVAAVREFGGPVFAVLVDAETYFLAATTDEEDRVEIVERLTGWEWPD